MHRRRPYAIRKGGPPSLYSLELQVSSATRTSLSNTVGLRSTDARYGYMLHMRSLRPWPGARSPPAGLFTHSSRKIPSRGLRGRQAYHRAPRASSWTFAILRCRVHAIRVPRGSSTRKVPSAPCMHNTYILQPRRILRGRFSRIDHWPLVPRVYLPAAGCRLSAGPGPVGLGIPDGGAPGYGLTTCEP